MPSSEVIRRLALALAIAIVAAAALWWSIDRFEARADERSEPKPASPRVPGGSQVVLPPGLPIGRAETITLARDVRRVARDAAPIAEIRPGGGVRLVRGAPAPAAPGVATSAWRAVVILPRSELIDLSARERAVLLELLSAWSGGIAVEVERVRAAGVRYRTEELEAVLRWQR